MWGKLLSQDTKEKKGQWWRAKCDVMKLIDTFLNPSSIILAFFSPEHFSLFAVGRGKAWRNDLGERKTLCSILPRDYYLSLHKYFFTRINIFHHVCGFMSGICGSHSSWSWNMRSFLGGWDMSTVEWQEN